MGAGSSIYILIIIKCVVVERFFFFFFFFFSPSPPPLFLLAQPRKQPGVAIRGPSVPRNGTGRHLPSPVATVPLSPSLPPPPFLPLPPPSFLPPGPSMSSNVGEWKRGFPRSRRTSSPRRAHSSALSIYLSFLPSFLPPPPGTGQVMSLIGRFFPPEHRAAPRRSAFSPPPFFPLSFSPFLPPSHCARARPPSKIRVGVPGDQQNQDDSISRKQGLPPSPPPPPLFFSPSLPFFSQVLVVGRGQTWGRFSQKERRRSRKSFGRAEPPPLFFPLFSFPSFPSPIPVPLVTGPF